MNSVHRFPPWSFSDFIKLLIKFHCYFYSWSSSPQPLDQFPAFIHPSIHPLIDSACFCRFSVCKMLNQGGHFRLRHLNSDLQSLLLCSVILLTHSEYEKQTTKQIKNHLLYELQGVLPPSPLPPLAETITKQGLDQKNQLCELS